MTDQEEVDIAERLFEKLNRALLEHRQESKGVLAEEDTFRLAMVAMVTVHKSMLAATLVKDGPMAFLHHIDVLTETSIEAAGRIQHMIDSTTAVGGRELLKETLRDAHLNIMKKYDLKD